MDFISRVSAKGLALSGKDEEGCDNGGLDDGDGNLVDKILPGLDVVVGELTMILQTSIHVYALMPIDLPLHLAGKLNIVIQLRQW
ncbi:hypothetical protein F0562_006172 [Nyssa sinensis]|uniref:Uncharacterized protein n=1 Tax=Nyssa sinensis TaxID=561372 RepID=A0A5J5AK86_9ASTE|nr:hypothetical protein F0562_006172 [Nyssa sinensis]